MLNASCGVLPLKTARSAGPSNGTWLDGAGLEGGRVWGARSDRWASPRPESPLRDRFGTAFLLPEEKSCAPFLGRPWKALFYFAHAVTAPGIVRIFHKNVLKYRDSVSARIHSC